MNLVTSACKKLLLAALAAMIVVFLVCQPRAEAEVIIIDGSAPPDCHDVVGPGYENGWDSYGNWTGECQCIEPTLDRGITNHDKAPRLSVPAAGRTDGGAQHHLNRLVGHRLLAEVAYRPLAVDGIEKRHVLVCHDVTPSNLAKTDAGGLC